MSESTRAERRLIAGIIALGLVGLVVGWRVFWFLTDDAYIAFRYVSNAHLGFGYVWNPPPFQPVEGYTSFLWVILLDVVWRVTGVEPPESANWMALVFSCGFLILSATMVIRLRWDGRLARHRPLYVLAGVVFLVGNRTILAWSSSGLETAMMNFFLLLWVFATLFSRTPTRRAGAGALTAACLALTRPDGLLYCAATFLVVLLLVIAEKESSVRRRIVALSFLPAGVVIAHVLWRFSFYGEWLPNTYYAKVIGSWPESGLRYLLSFILEYAAWYAVGFILWTLLVSRRGALRVAGAGSGEGRLHASVRLVVVGTLLLHVAYYTYFVGGDHFEYRVFSFLLPLLFLALIWSVNRLGMGPGSALLAVAGFVLLSLPVPWTHWALTRNLDTREKTRVMVMRVAPHWPKAFRWYADVFDDVQAWLISRRVCVRHQTHKVFWETKAKHYNTRAQGLQLRKEGYPVHAVGSVGVPAWVLPHVAIIDEFGLNDYVIARAPVPGGVNRHMAHTRRPPEGYVESFLPNVTVRGGEINVASRSREIDGRYIIENERFWRRWLSQRGGDPVPR